ncbi:MAG: hypothetical protein H7X77_08185, partial [Anaerolineae bacterium]|nr:hypothetical protein [Anaerolineae bacterium]
MTSRLPRILIAGLLVIAAALFVYYIASGSTNSILLIGALLLAVVALFEPVLILWDRFARDSALRPVRPYKVGTVERYFQVWLTEYGREQALFSTMSGDTVVQNRYRDNRQITYDDIVEVVENYSRFVIIGEPGEGKSSAMRSLMAQSIHNHRLSHGQTP